MNAFLITGILAIGQTAAGGNPPPSTSLDGNWMVVAAEINGRPAVLSLNDRSLAIHNNTLTLPGVAAISGPVRIEPGPAGALRAIPAATGTGSRNDLSRAIPDAAGGTGTAGGDLAGGGVAIPGTSGTGVLGGANGVYVRTGDYLVLSIGNPAAATGLGTGTGPTGETRSAPSGQGANAPPAGGRGTFATVGQPPISLVLRRANGNNAAPSTTAGTAPPAAATTPPSPLPPPTLRRVTSLIGTNVTLSDASSAGQIRDLVYGPNGMIDYAVIGNNGAFSPVPFDGLLWTGANATASLPLTRAQFGTIPTFVAHDWSNLTNPDFLRRLQSSYSSFRDANGRPLFNNSLNGNQGGVAAGSETGRR